MDLVKYTGEMKGKWRGPQTCHWYEFGPDRACQFVDNRDIPTMLRILGPDGEHVFEVV